jgi:hypothetical protein
MVAQKENRLDFAQIMNEGKIFLAKLAQGLIGEENSYLLGALLVTKFHQLAMGRQELALAARRNFWLYIDEFHHFITPSVASLLSGARKHRLGLILAHQELRQLWDQDPAVASAVLTNPATRVCFRVGDFDAKKLAEGFSFFDAKDLQSLGIGEALCRVERAEYDFNLKTAPPPVAEAAIAGTRREKLIALSRERYARKREEVEVLLAAARSAATAEPEMPVRERQPHVVHESKEMPTARVGQVPIAEPQAPASLHVVQPSRTEQRQILQIPQSSLPGRGGREHKYLQHLVKRLAEDRGYPATIEQPILDDAGIVDVSLEKGPRKIACEITVTTTSEWELGNIQKCVAAGYETVLVLSSDAKALKKLETAAKEFEPATCERVRFFRPEEFITYLDSVAASEASHEQTVRGYKVKVNYKPVGAAEAEARKQVISQVLVREMKRIQTRKA